jgi:hypothetical protein
MRTIWKWPLDALRALPATRSRLEVPREYLLNIPAGADFLHAGYDGNNQLCLWFHIPDSTFGATVERRFIVCGTGHELPMVALRYLGTVHESPPNIFVWHVYERMD